MTSDITGCKFQEQAEKWPLTIMIRKKKWEEMLPVPATFHYPPATSNLFDKPYQCFGCSPTSKG